MAPTALTAERTHVKVPPRPNSDPLWREACRKLDNIRLVLGYGAGHQQREDARCSAHVVATVSSGENEGCSTREESWSGLQHDGGLRRQLRGRTDVHFAYMEDTTVELSRRFVIGDL